MFTKKTIWKGFLSVIVCIAVHAVYEGLSSDYYKIYGIRNGHYTLATYLKSIFVCFLFITIYGYWLLYILALGLFKVIVNQLTSHSYVTYVGVGIVVSLASGLFFLMLGPDGITSFWTSFPSSKVMTSLPLLVLLGSIYGYIYKRWLR